MDYKLHQFEKFSDKRGDLIVFLKENDLEPNLRKFGQIYFVTFNQKNIIRGNHYHKKWREWFGIIAGKLELKMMDVNTKEEITMILDSKVDKYTRIEIGPNIVHAYRSLTKYAALLNYASSEWDQSDDYSNIIL